MSISDDIETRGPGLNGLLFKPYPSDFLTAKSVFPVEQSIRKR